MSPSEPLPVREGESLSTSGRRRSDGGRSPAHDESLFALHQIPTEFRNTRGFYGCLRRQRPATQEPLRCSVRFNERGISTICARTGFHPTGRPRESVRALRHLPTRTKARGPKARSSATPSDAFLSGRTCFAAGSAAQSCQCPRRRRHTDCSFSALRARFARHLCRR